MKLKEKIKKIFGILISVCLLIQSVPTPVNAAGVEEVCTCIEQCNENKQDEGCTVCSYLYTNCIGGFAFENAEWRSLKIQYVGEGTDIQIQEDRDNCRPPLDVPLKNMSVRDLKYALLSDAGCKAMLGITDSIFDPWLQMMIGETELQDDVRLSEYGFKFSPDVTDSFEMTISFRRMYCVDFYVDREDGVFFNSGSYFAAGETVPLDIHPAIGYILNELTVKRGNTDIPVTDNSFIMPPTDVFVTANFIVCDHTGGTFIYTPVDNGTQHEKVCSCGITATEDHNYTYTADGMTVTRACANCDVQPVSYTLVIPEGVRYGEGRIPYYTNTGTYTGELPVISFKSLPDGETVTEPTQVGAYEVTMTWGGKTVSGIYSIAQISPPVPNGENGWYTSASIPAPNGFRVAKSADGEAEEAVEIGDGDHSTGYTYYLVAENGDRTQLRTAPVKLDSKIDRLTTEAITEDISAFIEITAQDALSGIDESSFTIEWGTEPNEGAALGQYGTGKNNEGEDVMGFPITGLTPNTTYTVKVGVKDMAGNVQYQNCAVRTDLEHIREFTAPTAIDPEYTGEAQALVTPATAEGGTPMYRLSENENWSETVPTATEIGEYTVYYYFAGDENHEDSESMTVRASIGKTTPQAKHFEFTPPTDPVYDGEPNYADIAAKADCTGMGEVTVKLLDENGEETDARNVGTYRAVIDVAEGATCKAAEGMTDESWTFTVERCPVNISVPYYSKTYGEDDPSLDYTVSGIIASDAFIGTLSREPGESAGQYNILPGTVTEENNPNYKLNFPSNMMRFTVDQRDVYVKAKPQTVKYGEQIDPDAYEITGLLPGHTATAMLSASTGNVTKSGTVRIFNVEIKDAGGADVLANYRIAGHEDALLIIEPTDEMIAGLTEENVTSVDLGGIEETLAMTESAEYEDDTLDALKEKCEALLDAVEKAHGAVDTESVNDTLDVDPETVKLEDKAALTEAKADLEKALETYEKNFTAEERENIEEQITRIEKALDVIENAETVGKAVNELPETVEPDDDDTVARIEEAKKAYDKLTAHEKTLVPAEETEKLGKLLKAAVDYKIVEGHGEKWNAESDKPFTFTANGSFKKFVGIAVNSKEVDEKYYDAKSGSTIITLKESFLETLSTGDYEFAVVYTDGAAECTFHIEKAPAPSAEPSATPAPSADPTKAPIPATGDNSNIALYGTLLVLSLAAIAALLFVFKKRGQKK